MSSTELSSYEIVSIGRKFAKNKKYGPSTTLVSVCDDANDNPDFGRIVPRLRRLANHMSVRLRKPTYSVTLSDFNGKSFEEVAAHGVGRNTFRMLTGLRAGADEVHSRSVQTELPLTGATVTLFPQKSEALKEVKEKLKGVETEKMIEKMIETSAFFENVARSVGHKPVSKDTLIETLKDEVIRMSEERSNYESGRVSAFMDVIKLLGQALTDVPVEFQPSIIGLIIKVSEMHSKVGKV